MAFLEENFSPVGANSAKGQVPSLFSYKNTADSKAVMLADGYFTEVALQLNTNDAMTIVSSEGLGFFHVVSSNPVTKVVVVDDDIVVNSISAFYQEVTVLTSSITLTNIHNGNLISVDASGGDVTVTLPDLSTLADDFRVGVVKTVATDNVLTVARSGTDTINGSADSLVLSSLNTVVNFIGDQSTGKYVADIPAVDKSASFVQVHDISEFPNQSTAGIILENGVNYQVYIEGPISSDLLFQLESPYDKGGSMIYMGARGVLKWTHTNSVISNPFIDGSSLSGNMNFRLEGFEFIDDNASAKTGLELSGVSTGSKGGRAVIKNCKFSAFPKPINLIDMERVDFEEIVIAPAGTTQTAAVLEITTCEEINVSDSTLETQDSQKVINLDTSEVTKARFQNVDFVANHDNGLLNLDPANGDPTGPIIFSHCNCFNGTAITDGFKEASIGVVQNILDNGGKARVTTQFNHSVTTSPNDKLQLHETLSYESSNHTVLAVGVNTINLDTNFSVVNYGGNFTQGTLNPHTSEWIRVDNCNGIISPTPVVIASVHQSTTIQNLAVTDTLQDFAFTLGEIEQTISGLAKDFRLFNYQDLTIQYTGLTRAIVRITAKLTTVGAGTLTQYEFLVERLLANLSADSAITERFGFSRSAVANEKWDYFFTADMVMEPTRLLRPQLLQVGGTGNLVISDVEFGVQI